MSPAEGPKEGKNFAFCSGAGDVPASMILPLIKESGEFSSTAIDLECFHDKKAMPKHHPAIPMKMHTWKGFKKLYTANSTLKRNGEIKKGPDHEIFYSNFYKMTFKNDGTLQPPQPHAPEKRFQPNKHRIRTNCCAKWHQL